LDLPTLAYRRKRGDLIQVYKIMHSLNDVQKSTFFEMTSHSQGTRGHNLKIQKHRSRLRIRENSFSNRVANAWNNLPAATVNAKSINLFKNGVDKALSHVCNKYTYGTGPAWQQKF
jgi:hypothetical protein